jgi:uncharacterized membrane protein
MSTQRLEAFSDGVIAIIITIMVLELKVPHDASWTALLKLMPVFLSYVLSFIVVAIMWINHHHLLRIAKRVDGSLMWSNNVLLFGMSLIPFATGYMGEHHVSPLAVALYGTILAMAGFGFLLLRHTITHQNLNDPKLAAYNHRMQRKNLLSTTLYASAAPLAFLSVYYSFFIFLLIPLLYFLPERKLTEYEGTSP